MAGLNQGIVQVIVVSTHGEVIYLRFIIDGRCFVQADPYDASTVESTTFDHEVSGLVVDTAVSVYAAVIIGTGIEIWTAHFVGIASIWRVAHAANSTQSAILSQQPFDGQ